jgi:iron complex transport system ATP-binding protein
VTALTFRSVAVSYGKRPALLAYTDHVAAGEWLGVIGPNGAGKSSLLRAVAGLVEYSGSIDVDGRSLADMSRRERAAVVAYVPQDPLIPDDMSVSDYVLLGRTPYISYLGSPTRDDRAVVTDVLERLDLTRLGARYLGALSGGERQRVVLARAIAQQAPVMLLDEPTSALDIGHQQQALELVTTLRVSDGLTIVSALHDLTLAGTYADRLTMFDGGAVAATGSAGEVLTAERLAEVYHVNVSVEVDPDDGTVVVIPRRGSPGV